ncbi:MAG TPA: L,D-transpeptidase family protein [Pyrinomonadaceae bacterium]|nr:L,D-transpeptidase family protein [Pyrinomonadaceae bacterium]
MRRFLRGGAAAVLASAVLLAGACVNQPATNTSNTAAPPSNANANANSNANTNTRAAGANTAPVTLAVLDALFVDEKFAGELKSRLGLTDEQVESVRKLAREETAALRESEGDEERAATTTEATRRASEKIRAVVGPEKTEQLLAYAGERWASGGEEGASGGAAAGASAPNSVPDDTRVVVNIPAYRMDAFENGKLVKSYKVGIGYPEFPLPTGLRRASQIIFNPTWTPPDEPWVEASTKVKPGERVEAGSKLNPLGLIKIPIGSPSLIHGGKSPARLGTFASHGCVGLTNPQVQDFAQLLARLGGAEVSKEDVASYAKTRTETKDVKLGRPVPVELRYETIVVSDGRLHIYRDVYDKGTNTEENLRAVLQAHGVAPEQLSEEERAQVQQALTEMARDAAGRPADGTPSATPSPTPAAKRESANANKGPERVTRNVKGRKEVVIQIAALAGKGYPAPSGEGFALPKDATAPKQQQKQQADRPARAAARR